MALSMEKKYIVHLMGNAFRYTHHNHMCLEMASITIDPIQKKAQNTTK